MDNDDPNQDRRKALQGSRSALPAAEGPASPDVVDSAISLLLEGFGGRTASPDKAMAYGIALEGLSAANIARGVKAILRGEVAGIDPAFPPSAAQLAKACRPITFLSRPVEWFTANDEKLRLRDYERSGFQPLGDITLALARQIEEDKA